jgi:acyl-CoA thioesterase FadM
MGMLLRTIGVFLAAQFRGHLALFGGSELGFRVLPSDLDFNMHMNNARYLGIMDIGRIDLILRTGMWRAMWQNRWQAVLGGSMVRYRRPLRPLQRMELSSRLIGWDDKWLYIEHRIEARGVVACQAVVRAAFVGADGIVAPVRLAGLLGHGGVSPDLPGWVASWRDADTAFGQPGLAAA